jgi:hypothetical protein
LATTGILLPGKIPANKQYPAFGHRKILSSQHAQHLPKQDWWFVMQMKGYVHLTGPSIDNIYLQSTLLTICMAYFNNQ